MIGDVSLYRSPPVVIVLELLKDEARSTQEKRHEPFVPLELPAMDHIDLGVCHPLCVADRYFLLIVLENVLVTFGISKSGVLDRLLQVDAPVVLCLCFTLSLTRPMQLIKRADDCSCRTDGSSDVLPIRKCLKGQSHWKRRRSVVGARLRRRAVVNRAALCNSNSTVPRVAVLTDRPPTSGPAAMLV